jgi:hypothetical protein
VPAIPPWLVEPLWDQDVQPDWAAAGHLRTGALHHAWRMAELTVPFTENAMRSARLEAQRGLRRNGVVASAPR